MEGVVNMRDLGGLAAAGGHVRPGLLLRSGSLAHLSDKGAAALQDVSLTTVIDLRTSAERDHEPDAMLLLPGVKHLDLPLLDPKAAGVFAGESLEQLVQDELNFERHAREGMLAMYRSMIAGEQGQAALSAVFAAIVEAEKGAVLWHCTEGKDRTGVTAALVEHVLGVSEEDILRDYLASNAHTHPMGERLLKMLAAHGMAPETAKRFLALLQVDAAYLAAARDEAVALAGSVDAYLVNVLGVTPQAQATLRARYLA
jgi:protein-tyrosine phosphatase